MRPGHSCADGNKPWQQLQTHRQPGHAESDSNTFAQLSDCSSLTPASRPRTIPERMKSVLTPKAVIAVFFGALVFYFASFHGLEHLRHRRGPWEVAFMK